MPYEAARTSVLLALGCIALSDHPSAERELANARVAFEGLGAHPDLERLQSLRARAGVDLDTSSAPTDDSGLSPRELEVLAHVARGETNAEIAVALTISPHTVGRHLENIFAKVGVSGRAAATAFAYEHDLL
jgi:DNA-binding CsgD family transcriptional regulator